MEEIVLEELKNCLGGGFLGEGFLHGTQPSLFE